jgi:hypothetical protein
MTEKEIDKRIQDCEELFNEHSEQKNEEIKKENRKGNYQYVSYFDDRQMR